MLWPVALTVLLAAGWFVARTLTAGAWPGPRWATALVELSLGALFGPGLASVLYFALVASGMASRGAVVGMLTVLLAAGAGLWWKLTPAAAGPDTDPKPQFPYVWGLVDHGRPGTRLFLSGFSDGVERQSCRRVGRHVDLESAGRTIWLPGAISGAAPYLLNWAGI